MIRRITHSVLVLSCLLLLRPLHLTASAEPTGGPSDLRHTILGLSARADRNELDSYVRNLQREGYKVRTVSNDYPEKVDGLNARDLNREALEVSNSQGTILMTILLEKDGSAAIICGEEFVPPVHLECGGKVILKPGQSAKEIRATFASAIVKDSGWKLTIKLPDGWLVCKFINDTLYSLTLSSPPHGP